MLHIQATREVLETTVARLSGVLEVAETPSQKTVLMTGAATDLVQEPLQLAHLLGGGQGLRIGISEPEACVETAHEAFQGVLFETPLTPCTGEGTAAHDGHSTKVAGALAGALPPSSPSSTTRPPEGLVGLFQGRVFFANGCGVGYSFLQRNPHLVNLSCFNGTTPEFDSGADLDQGVFANRVFIAKGAGNIAVNGDQAFCHSYDALCVGGYLHNNTLGPENFGDDSPAGSWKNGSLGREKPDLVGPYTGKLPLYNKPIVSAEFPYATYASVSGTSFSTPFVVGTAALLMANFPQHLIGDPTLTRAVLMASASHSFQGFARVPVIGDSIDDRTGAGAPRGDRAREMLNHQRFFSRFVDRNVDFNAAGDLTAPISFQANPGDRVRIVLTYDQCLVSNAAVDDSLMADLDLSVIENQLGQIQVHTNASHVDNKEIIEFTVGQSQAQITVKVRAQHWDPCTDGTRKTYLAIAWDVLAEE